MDKTTQIMSTSARSPSKCARKKDTCPKGHEMIQCVNEEGYYCRQCGSLSFQPNKNRLGDKCRLRKYCGDALWIEYASIGDTVTDAHCKCKDGHHFENEDQRACVPNRVCGKGYGQGTYGVCEFCLDKKMYSDVEDRLQRCKPLTNCQKNKSCVIKKSNGTFDNVCGPEVRDINDCSSIVEKVENTGVNSNLVIILGATGALLIIAIIITLLIVLIKRRRNKRKRNAKPLTTTQLEELKQKILVKCEIDDSLCKKALSTSFRVIEDRIDRQIWTLPQELFRSHLQPGRYEVLVEKYKESQEKYAVNGYLREWREWKGATQESVTELFHSLRQCKRDDIIYEICNKMYNDVDIAFDVEANDIGGHNNRAKDGLLSEIMDILFPCLKSPSRNQDNDKKAENQETTDKLLGLHSREMDVNKIVGERNYPSAPVYSQEDNTTSVDPHTEGCNRQFSLTVQCTT